MMLTVWQYRESLAVHSSFTDMFLSIVKYCLEQIIKIHRAVFSKQFQKGSESAMNPSPAQ